MEDKFDLSLYNDKFFEWHLKYAREYSIKTMDWFIKTYPVNSVLDVGCGIGSYLESAHNAGCEIRGVEISRDAFKYTPIQVQNSIIYCDATEKIKFPVPFDCVISFETAEHIDPKGTDQFVLNLVNATGKYLLFTAAPPGQDGCGHINCKPKQFWLDAFKQRLLKFDEEMTKDISDNWRKLGAPNYICDNLIVFRR